MTRRLGWGTYRCADDITTTAATMVAVGADWIDTAPNYGDGHAQTALAPVLANKPQVMVSTKVGYVPGPLRAAAVRAGVLPDSAQTTGYCIDAAYVRWQIHRNLAELGRDRVEVMFLHNPEHLTMSGSGLKERISAAFAELETAARGGLIDGYGIATWHGFHGHFTIADLVHAAYAAGGLDHHLIAVQLPVSLIEIRHLAEALERRGPLIDAARAGLRVFASAPLGGGRLPGMVGPELASLVGRGLSGAGAALAGGPPPHQTSNGCCCPPAAGHTGSRRRQYWTPPLSIPRPCGRSWMCSPETDTRMRVALHHAAHAFGLVLPDGDGVAWGWRGRTIGALATRHDRCLWLRVAEYRLKDRGGDIWNGTRTAAAHIPSEVPRPHLLGIHAWEDGDRAYQAELTTYVDSPPCSAAPVLRHSLDLDTDWWRRLRGALTALPRVTTERRVISQDYLDRALPTFLNAPGIDTTPPVGWQAAHGDLHWANLTRDGPVLLDWEGWGLAPAGYDVALLAVHSMLIPSVEARVRAEFAHILSTPAGRFAELIVIAELLQAAQRGDNPDLAERLPARVRSLLDG